MGPTSGADQIYIAETIEEMQFILSLPGFSCCVILSFSDFYGC